jgi:hypothetical protein
VLFVLIIVIIHPIPYTLPTLNQPIIYSCDKLGFITLLEFDIQLQEIIEVIFTSKSILDHRQ